MKQDALPEHVDAVISEVRRLGYEAHVVPGSTRVAIGVTGNLRPLDSAMVDSLPGVLHTLRVSVPFKLVSRESKPDNTVVEIDGVRVGGTELTVIAGPCAVESADQLFAAAERAKQAGVHLLRGGAFKPRTSPYSFQGLGEEGMKLLAEAKRRTGLPTVSEAVDEESCDLAARYVDVIQVGARNMQNYALLKRIARIGKPVLLKRGIAATLEEFLNAAEYVLAAGNPRVILCERGVRGFSDFARHTLDVTIIPAVKEISHLPIITDPSHAAGRRTLVVPLALASIAAGADGVMVEIHPEPARALSDGYQSLLFPELDRLLPQIADLAPVVGRSLSLHR